MQRLDMKAVHENDLKAFLERNGLYESFQAGERRCHCCGEVVSMQNLGAMLSVKREVQFICNKFECLSKVRPESARE